MKTLTTTRFPGRALSICAMAAGLTFALSSCAGSAGSGGGGGGDGGDAGSGFEYGASQEDVNSAIEGLDPITIKFQPSAASQNSVMAPAGTVFKEIVEERSNGQIEVEITWGQAIAGYAEVHDALADGRLDVAYTLPVYQPTEFPAVNDLGTAMAGLSASPYLGELVANAVGNEIGWGNENVLSQYEEKGLVPLTPLAASGGYYTVCSEPVESADDWQGLQTRIASTAQSAQVQHLGGSPVSMEYVETFEALQRGTVDCTLGQLVPSAEAGIFEVAPNLGYTTTASFSRSPGAYLAGSSFADMPLAYQQIIFDSNALASSGGMEAVIGGNAAAVQQAKDAGGEVTPFADDIQEEISNYSTQLTDEAIGNGQIDENIETIIQDAGEKWAKEFEDLGYTDEGETADFNDWYDESKDFMDYATASYENGNAMKHRPS
ncbi:C4-dicarboxylate ABC transporter substrate-binding protein [uncultured Brevibacterium sp.]|uniref:C4-dicarboxylate ABC transporter substrate-binding protein n=1 Tax=uncultured Brevibacterium sp. TaxID=189678 RepID=UPI0025F2AC34|nr:C4-dicarboxylate ABC transporter substrate-binding protein [uncultured Brevibacterium sp.]